MTSVRRVACVALSIIALLAQDRVARADTDTPEQLFDRGWAAMERHDYEAACSLFDKSYAASRATGPLQGLAACNEARGLYRQALMLWREAERSLPPDSPTLPDAHAAVLRLQNRVALLTIELSEHAPSATRVELDGEVVAIDGNAIEVDPTVSHSLVAVAPGYEPSRVAVRLAEAEHRTLAVAPGSARPKGTIGPVRGTGIGLVTLGALGFVTAAVTGGVLIAQEQTIDAGCAGVDHTDCNATALSASENAHALAPWNVGAWVVGLAATGAGLPMVVVGDRASSHNRDHVTARVVVRGLAVALEGRF